MTSKRITQETFDAAVRENIEEFEMGPEEAVKEATEQFESQGVDLSNIVKIVPKASADGSQEPIHDVLQALGDLQESVTCSRPQEVLTHLTRFCDLCKQHKACRFLAAQKGAYPIILAAWKLAAAGDQDLLLQALNALSVLTDGQPDLLDAQGLQLLVDTLAQNADEANLTCSGIRCVRHACLKHEQNRQGLVKAGVLPLLTSAIAQHGQHADVVREACCALRIMTFDDDIRVPYSNAHNHAKMIVQENRGLKVLIEAAKAFPDNPSILSELCSTLSRLAVRNEFCQEVVDLGGLSILVTLLANCNNHQDLVKQVLSALRAIAGNDDVKDAIVRAGGTESIVTTMAQHLANPQVCEQSCAALSVLALRKPENSRTIVEGGGALAALQAMKAHPQEAGVQASLTWALPTAHPGLPHGSSRSAPPHRPSQPKAFAQLRPLEHPSCCSPMTGSTCYQVSVPVSPFQGDPCHITPRAPSEATSPRSYTSCLSCLRPLCLLRAGSSPLPCASFL
ncbi:armadillo repeat-containing protein 6 isoform X1 [Sciurus carolinensis]|uniref:armadillo repeat-containing protein 6 isoform X1 n=1 Tax=Sciurus carolinensis TaxID=30640 RepID=UPI001FB4FBDE|nr:armadillo repeat-containing protein 6 isoform X1 [Sciurus carolinensis]XP_047388578.1 armadillo repeat-containing protein 6 isoform X1 [Sciurus carolinensis]XP_047388579.1 armadillo repeat-containing protein 6 isoform X1 [Sciurus carolinensis]XP_047388580.1 armadillo repeat-containing protein 6 isoform X1 [Sciurus carolinensis]XP_047388581.1 armadillo repeat-containing protein 6 isoform X1 [Sciurus carolinensis]XP_047388582.1 armadillo repeat-containing protein 6 isoform X1 [Sciurus carolin